MGYGARTAVPNGGGTGGPHGARQRPADHAGRQGSGRRVGVAAHVSATHRRDRRPRSPRGTGLDVEIVGIYSDPRHVIEYNDGEVRQQFNICFSAGLVGGTLRRSDKSTDVRWIPADGLDDLAGHHTTQLRLPHPPRARAARPKSGDVSTACHLAARDHSPSAGSSSTVGGTERPSTRSITLTAEIAVMNRQGVALAADSAVTVTGHRGPKIFTSADKIFALSKYHPVATMVYGAASLMQVPWETIVKVYRHQLADKAFPTLDGYASDFMDFLVRPDNLLFGDSQKHTFAYVQACQFFEHLADVMIRAVQEATDSAGGSLTLTQSRRPALKVIGDHHKSWSKRPDRPGITEDVKAQLASAYADDIHHAKTAVFEHFGLPPGASRRLRRACRVHHRQGKAS